MNMLTRQAALFIRKGPRPIARDCLAILQSSWNNGFEKCRILFLSEKYLSVYMRAISWHRTVAIAAPLMPMPRANMNIGSSIAFDATVKSVRYMAVLGLPEDLMSPLKPKDKWVTTLPIRMMNM